MEKNEHDEITAFDTLYTNNHIQMLKIIMPYFDHPIRQKLAVYIKYLEFQYTLSYFQSHPFELCGCSYEKNEKKEFSVDQICSDIIPFCTTQEKQRIEQIAGLIRTMDMYKEMSRMMEVMKTFNPDGSSGMPADFSPDMFSSLFSGGVPNISPDMLSSFSSMFGGKSDNVSAERSESNTNQEHFDGNHVNETNSGNGMMDMLMGMLSPEQKTMFEMFGGNNTHESE